MRHQFTFWLRDQVNRGFLGSIAVGYGPPDALVPVIDSKDNVTVSFSKECVRLNTSTTLVSLKVSHLKR